MKGWNRIAWGVAGATLLFLALADTHSGVITKHVSSISLLGQQKQQIEKLDVVAQRTWFDRCELHCLRNYRCSLTLLTNLVFM